MVILIREQIASEGDMYILKQFNQAQSVILDSRGNFNIFGLGGEKCKKEIKK